MPWTASPPRERKEAIDALLAEWLDFEKELKTASGVLTNASTMKLLPRSFPNAKVVFLPSEKATFRPSGFPTVDEYVGDYATTDVLDLRQPMSTSRSATTASTNSVSLLAESQDANSWASFCAQARYSGFARMWSTASRTCSGVGVSVAR